MENWRRLKYKNLTIFFTSIIFAIILSRFEAFHSALLSLGSLGYVGAFVAGMLFVSTFSVATGAVILLILAEKLNPLEIALLAGAGGVAGDFLIFRFVRNGIIDEVKEVYEMIDHRNHLHKILHTKYFGWFFPVFGALIIMSPLPDELGVSLLGIGKMKTYQFLILAFILDVAGVFFVVSLSRFIKP